jgi:hypothetical protein
VEADAIAGDLLAHGKAHDVSTPLIARLCESLDLSAGARARPGAAPPVEKTAYRWQSHVGQLGREVHAAH